MPGGAASQRCAGQPMGCAEPHCCPAGRSVSATTTPGNKHTNTWHHTHLCDVAESVLLARAGNQLRGRTQRPASGAVLRAFHHEAAQ